MIVPLKNGRITQSFGMNGNTTYARDGMMGHPAADLETSYKDTIVACADGVIYKVFNLDNPDLSKYRAVCQLINIGGIDYEVTYGHIIDAFVKSGFVKEGTTIASEGNTGEVFANGVAVTEAQKEQGSKAGTHLHWQMREVKKVKVVDPKKQYLQSQEGGTYFDGEFYYEVPAYNNGYNGCVDPLVVLRLSLLIQEKTLLQKLIELLIQKKK